MSKVSRQQIIHATAELIEHSGNVDPKVTQIAKQLSISHAALYKHFTDKDALLTAVAVDWFQKTIYSKIDFQVQAKSQIETLHTYLWQFVNAKKTANQQDPVMFQLNTDFIDAHPLILRTILQDFYVQIDQLMNFDDTHHQQSEAILATFSIFTLPTFRDTWYTDDYQERFEQIWQLIEPSLSK